MTNKIILFDGVCNFCNSSVQFIIKRDPNAKFNFASMQGDAGKELLNNHSLNDYNSSFVYIDEDKAYVKSTAALRICKDLKGFWKLCYLFIIIPAPIRNFFYNILANNRYKWFGKRDSCMIPSPDVRKRFLD